MRLKQSIGSEGFDTLVAELSEKRIKFSLEAIVLITRGVDTQIYWLETGNPQSGLNHILLRHRQDFERLGLIDDQSIAYWVMHTIHTQTPIHYQDREQGFELVFEVVLQDKLRWLLTAIGKNGYVVTAYFTRKP